MTEPGLETTERAFFAALDNVVYGNPFSDERAELIRRLVPGATEADLIADREALTRLVEPRLRRFGDASVLHALASDDFRLVRSGFLYVCYHHHVLPIDRFIEGPTGSLDASAVDQVAQSVIRELAQCGVGEEEATRYFAHFFQLRRAYHFIVRSLTGNCESMRKLRRAMWDNVFTHDMRVFEAGLYDRMEDFSTLVLGETGTGKGAAAAAIGRSEFIPYLPAKRCFAANFADCFMAINLSQFPETLIESELFGHKKGAFTGAIGEHEGVFERCNAYGALFLDEIGEVPIPVQIKLLQVLQDRTFTPLGSHETKRFAGRVIAATNRPLDELRHAGQFRDDLYYRLCSDMILVPTLRQRIDESPQELEDMVRLLVLRIAGREDARLCELAMDALERDLPRDYRWPGNVRELEQAVRRILLTGRYGGDAEGVSVGEEDQLMESMGAGSLSAQELLRRYCSLLYRRFGTYAEVAQRTGLDRRTVRKHVVDHQASVRAVPRKP